MKKMLLIVLCLCVAKCWAQSRSISGKVVDSLDNPIAKASIAIKGSRGGTYSNEDGSFTLTVPGTAKALVVTAVGFVENEVGITDKADVKVVMKSLLNTLSEVVVVGYGTRSVKEVTGAISKISTDKVVSEPVSSFEQALAGKTAGVQIGTSTGNLADRTAIRVRGINSITSSSQPLVVIDGVPQMDVGNLNGFNSGNGTRFDPLALVNAADIESIEVLKDAGSAVVYGSRASNGVILITTKKGKKGSIKVNYDSKVGFASARKLPSLLDAQQFATIMNEKVANRYGTAVQGYPVVTYKTEGVNQNTNWLNELYRTGMTYDNSVSFSGGAEKLSIYGSARYLKQEGITIRNALQTGQVRLNMDFIPKTWFKSGVSVSYSKTLNKGVLTDGYIAGASVSGWQAPPNVSPYNKDGQNGYNLTGNGLLNEGLNNPTITLADGSKIGLLPGNAYYVNVVAATALNRNDNTAQDLRANIYGEVQFFKGLKYTSKFGIQNLANFEDQYSSPYISGLGTSTNGLVQNLNQNWNQWIWQNYLSYDKSFARVHKLNVVAGIEDQYNKYLYTYTGASNFTDPYFTHVIDNTYTNTNINTGQVEDNTGGNIYSKGMISYFGRANYSFATKYFIEVAFRRDGYSGFGAGNQFGNFPSVSAGWEITKENFMTDINWLHYLKLRASYGEVGNSSGVGPYDARSVYSGAAYTSLNGMGLKQLGNPALKWESAKKLDIGIDATFLKGRLSATVDYFSNNIDNLILQAPVLYTTGIPNASITTNIGRMYNKGLEVTLNATPVLTKEFSWTTSFNFTTIKNRVTALVSANNNADISGTYAYTVASVGKPLGSFFMPEWVGVDEATGNPVWYAKDRSKKIWDFGAQKWMNEKGEKVSALGSADFMYTGKSGLPTYYGGWDNTLNYKDFDFSMSFNFSGGNYIYNSSKAAMLTNSFSNNFSAVMSRWTKAGDKTDIPRLYANDNAANSASTRFLEKGDYIRLRTVGIGYKIPQRLANKMDIDHLRVYFQVFNPLVFTKYSGLDPDVNYISQTSASTSSVSSANNSNITLGVDNRATPQSKVFTIGLSVGF